MVFAKRFWGVFAIAMLWGCAWKSVTSYYDPEARFAGLKTYAWMPDREEKTGDHKMDKPLLDEYIRKAVENQLSAKGFHKQAPDMADSEINYHAALTGKMNDQTLNDYYGYTPSSSPRSVQVGRYEVPFHEYDMGSLIIDIVDPETRRLIWRGSAQHELDPNPNQEERKKKIDEAVRKILEQFPPR